jgi:hypothetical protein
MKLDPDEKYYPKVSRDFDGAFFGVAPTSVQPASESIEIGRFSLVDETFLV